MNNTPPNEAEVFAEALALPSAERDRYLETACRGDDALRGRVARLLQAHEAAGSFMAALPVARADACQPDADPDSNPAGERIGRYKLLQKIGEGGCGVVYLAEQDEPVRRRVAVKVIKLGMDTKEVVARFEAERQALALMDHPNIARIFDGGATETGRPYVVMELVRGVPITKYCDEQSLPTRSRLELFVQVCQAVQHAHQKGIIHRDLKPSNILVALQDGIAVPKVIDFGIAKTTQGRLTDATLFTAFEQFIGTPAYMSPEQAEFSGLDIDTRSDIYSLGVLLYELLTGRTPFDPKSLVSAGLDEIRRIIREVEPPRPSTRLSTLTDADRLTVAKRRATVPTSLSTLLRGELDWIVMRCLEKDRSRRYETANGLAVDVQRHLHNEPVLARPPSAVYRLQKFTRRHRVAMAAAASIVGALATGLAVALWEYSREAAARALAEQRRTEVESINRFLVSEMLGSATPHVARGREITVQEVLRNAATRISGAFGTNALLEASVRHTIGVSFLAIGKAGDAEPHITAALAKRREVLGPGHPDTLESQSALGSLRRLQSRLPEAEKVLRETRALQIRSVGRAHEQTLKTTNELCLVLAWLRRDKEAEPLARDAWEAATKHWGPEHEFTLKALHSFIAMLPSSARQREGDKLYAQLLAAERRVLGPNHPDTIGTMNDYGRWLRWNEKLPEAEEMLAAAVSAALRLHGPDHAGVAQLQWNHALNMRANGKLAEGSAVLRTALETNVRVMGPDTIRTRHILESYLQALVRDRHYAEAAAAGREWISRIQQSAPADDQPLIRCLMHWGAALNGTGDYSGAETVLREAAQKAVRLPTPSEIRHLVGAHLGASLIGQGRMKEAETEFLAAVRNLPFKEGTWAFPDLTPERTGAIRNLVRLYTAMGKPTETAKWTKQQDEENLVRADEARYFATLDRAERLKLDDLRAAAQIAFRNKRPADAIGPLQQRWQTLRDRLGADHCASLATMTDLAQSLCDCDRLADARRLADEAFSLSRDRLGPDHTKTIAREKLAAEIRKRLSTAPQTSRLP